MGGFHGFVYAKLDATILNTALPTIATDLQTPVFEMQMAIIAYSLAVALFIPLTAWAAAKFGTLTVFRSAVFTFVFGSVACASLETLVRLHGLCLHEFSKVLAGHL